MRNTAKQKLVEVNRRFTKDIEETAPKLLESAYSNPYFISIPENWFTTKSPRILIVGEEGFGTYGCGKRGKTDDI